tara:strand:+ start:370 stop:645 length:276 start_codon:yes stop_codon:yes gene_type:complete
MLYVGRFLSTSRKSRNLAFSSIESGENGVRIETLIDRPNPPVGPQKSLKEKHDYFGKLNIQKKGELQKYLHKKKWALCRDIGEIRNKKTLH